MTAVSLNQPVQDTQDWHTPLNQNFADIEREMNVHDRIVGGFMAREQSSPDLTVAVDAGVVFESGSLSSVAAQNTSTLAAPASQDRIDRIVIDASTGSISVEAGTEAASPTAPAIPAGKLPCAQIYWTPGMAAINNSDLTDERVFGIAPGSAIEDIMRTLTISATYLNQTVAAGDYKLRAVDDEPAGWLQCNGQEVSRTTYADLFAAIGTTYGNGDGSTTFNVPDWRDRSPLGLATLGGSDAGRVDNYSTTTMGDTGGADEHTLTVSEMPAHDHGNTNSTANISSIDATTDAGNDTSVLAAGSNAPGTNSVTVSASAINGRSHNHGISNEGGGNAHDNMHPFITVNVLIKT